MNTKYPALLSPIKLAGLTLKNRIFSAPTSASELGAGEKFTRENIEYYKLRAAGGAAVVCVGEVIVDLDNGRSHPQQIGIDRLENGTVFCQLVDAIHSHGAAASAELDHGGALCAPEFIGKTPAGPSAYVDDWGDEVRAMTEEEILRTAKCFGQAAANAKRYGFDMVTVHAGHGWLIHQFLSPLTNFRTDKWGGTTENRLRFLLLCIDEIRAAVGKNFPIEVRISGSERTPGGYDIDFGVEIAKALDGKVDLIHVSAGTQQVEYSCVKMHPGPFEKDMENRNLAAEIKKHVKTPVCSVGAYNFPQQMEDAITSGDADCIALGRALVADPFLPKKIIEGREADITPCLRCSDCMSSMIAFKGMRCAVNPITGCTGTDDHKVRFFLYGGMGRHLRCGLFGIGDTAVMANLHAFSAGDALLRVDPILCVFQPNGVHGTFHSALMAGGTIFLIDYIGHNLVPPYNIMIAGTEQPSEFAAGLIHRTTSERRAEAGQIL